MRRLRSLVVIAATIVPLVEGKVARACPVCGEETGRQVRAGIFDDRFGLNLIATALPFAVFVGVAAAIHGVTSRRGARPASEADPADGR